MRNRTRGESDKKGTKEAAGCDRKINTYNVQNSQALFVSEESWCDPTLQLADGLSLRRGRLINGVIWRTAICFTAHMCVYSSLNDFGSNYAALPRSSIMGDG